MRRFVLPLTVAVSAAILTLYRCGSEEWQVSSNAKVCVDESGKRVADQDCANSSDLNHHWYYISRGGYVPRYGYPAQGGGYTPSNPGAYYEPAPASPPAGAVTRGGFGASGGESSGEGHGAGE